MSLGTGQVVHNRYKILGLLGQGGMGAVYRAFDQWEQRSCAVKEMRPSPEISQAKLEGLRDQFRREAAVLASLSYPGLTRVTDYFTEGRNEYLVMDFVQGQSLQDVLKASGRTGLPEEQVMGWAGQLLDTLEYIHAHSVIHRDIKPANIRLTVDGRVVLVDFGLVKLWDPRNPETVMALRGAGTPQYAPPEQLDNAFGHTDARSDIYSLGATLYALLTGRVPPLVTDRVLKNVQIPPLRSVVPGITPAVDEAVSTALQLGQAQRFQSAAEMRQAMGIPRTASLVAAATTAPPALSRIRQPVPAAPAGRSAPARSGVPSWAWLLVGAAVLALLCVLVSVGALTVLAPR
jgi:eukaryotic-like serine/threonine-protein kinase